MGGVGREGVGKGGEPRRRTIHGRPLAVAPSGALVGRKAKAPVLGDGFLRAWWGYFLI